MASSDILPISSHQSLSIATGPMAFATRAPAEKVIPYQDIPLGHARQAQRMDCWPVAMQSYTFRRF